MRIPRAPISRAAVISLSNRHKKFGYFYPAAIAILYFAWFIARKDYWIHVGGRNMKISASVFETVSVFVGLRPVTKKSRHRGVHAYQSAGERPLLESEFIPAIVHFFPEHRIFQIISLSGEKVFLPRQKPGLEKSTCHRYQTPPPLADALRGYFQLCDRNPMNWCLFSKPGNVSPGLSGEGDEARATAELFRANKSKRH